MIWTSCKISSYSLFNCLHRCFITHGLLCIIYYDVIINEKYVAASSEISEISEITTRIDTCVEHSRPNVKILMELIYLLIYVKLSRFIFLYRFFTDTHTCFFLIV